MRQGLWLWRLPGWICTFLPLALICNFCIFLYEDESVLSLKKKSFLFLKEKEKKAKAPVQEPESQDFGPRRVFQSLGLLTCEMETCPLPVSRVRGLNV